MTRLLRNLAVASLSASIALILSTAAAAAWLEPTTLSGLDANGGYPAVAVNDSGQAVVVWSVKVAGEYAVYASSRQSNDTWTAGVPISGTSAEGMAQAVAMNAAGKAVAVWSRLTGGHWVMETATRQPNGNWSAAAPLSELDEDSSSPAVAVNGSGDAVAGWVRFDGTVQASVRLGAAGWAPHDDLGIADVGFGAPQVAIDPDGSAVLVTTYTQHDHQSVQRAERPAAGEWTNLQTVSPPDSRRHQLAANADGEMLLAWMTDEGDDATVQSIARSASGAWGAAQMVPRTGIEVRALALGPTGDAIAVVELEAGGALMSSSRPAGGTWVNAIGLHADHITAIPQVRLDSGGNATVAWSWAGGVQTLDKPAAGLWTTPKDWQDIDVENARAASIAMDSAGNAVLVWDHITYTDAAWKVQAVVRDAAGPAITSATIPKTAVRGRGVAFAVSASDPWTPLAGDPFWTFGDGATATGANVKHSYAARGTFIVRVRQSDSAGNTTMLTRTVKVGFECVVPRLAKRTLDWARKKLQKAHCSVGKVRKAYSAAVPKGRVIAQGLKPGTRRFELTPVSLVVSRGPR